MNLEKQFKKPTVEWRGKPLWSWKGKLIDEGFELMNAYADSPLIVS